MIRLSLPLLCVVANAAAQAPEIPVWEIAADTELNFRAMQQGAEFSGKFEEFEIAIRFSSDGLAESAITVTVAVASVNTAYEDRDTALRSEHLLDVAQWPEAFFRTAEFRDLGGDNFEAVGDMTIRDRTRRIALPFTFTTDGDEAQLAGELTISRLDYGIGQGDWADTTWVGRDVTILFDFELTAATDAKPQR